MTQQPDIGQVNPEGKLSDNIAYFARALRKAGLKTGPADTSDAIRAVMSAGIGSRDDFYWCLHGVLVRRRQDHAVFDEAFRLFWRSRHLIEKMIALMSPLVRADQKQEAKRPGQDRAADALGGGATKREVAGQSVLEVEARLSASQTEVLRNKDFAQMSADEIALARRAISSLELPDDKVATRRYKADSSGHRIDQRAMMRAGVRTGGSLILPRYRSRRIVHPPLVLIADISGSMSQYSRLLLHFAHALAEQRSKVHSFLFGTRLTNITRQLAQRDPDVALEACAAAVVDWEGGTRIAGALEEFNRHWSRRVLSQGAVVLLMTDGLEREDTTLLEKETERLQKSCRRLIWLNPLLRFEGFQPKAGGVRAMLAHVDEFRSAHSLEAIEDLVAALGAKQGRSLGARAFPAQGAGRRWMVGQDQKGPAHG